VGDGGGVDELVLHMCVNAMSNSIKPVAPSRTGTFFCEMTTAQSLPRTPNDVMFAAVIALNAYSVWPQLLVTVTKERRGGLVSCHQSSVL
jgi:hypothetical protein